MILTLTMLSGCARKLQETDYEGFCSIYKQVTTTKSDSEITKKQVEVNEVIRIEKCNE